MRGYHLIFLDVFEAYEFVLTAPVIPKQAAARRRRRPRPAVIEEPGILPVPLPAPTGRLIEILAPKLSTTTGTCTVVATICGSLCGRGLRASVRVLLEFPELAEYLVELPLPLLLLDVRLRDHERPLLVHEVARAHTPRYRTVYPIPLTLEVGLNLLQTVQGTHFLWCTFRLLLLLLLVGAR